MTVTLVSTEGRANWSGERSRKGHRTFTLETKLDTSDSNDGPFTVMISPLLPQIGDVWDFGNDVDVWAFCLPTMQVKKRGARDGGPVNHWTVTQTFTTEPQERCQDDSIEDPLNEPDTLSGGFVKYTREAQSMFDANGDIVPILNSADDLITGIERDDNRPTVRIGQNVADLELDLITGKMDKLNDSSMWGLEARQIKLSNITWQRLLFGTCSFYYRREFEFDINFEGFDLMDVMDAGFNIKNLSSGNKEVAKDGNGENSPTRLPLDGAGGINGDPFNNPVFLDEVNGLGPVRLYDETDLLELGIPDPLTS